MYISWSERTADIEHCTYFGVKNTLIAYSIATPAVDGTSSLVLIDCYFRILGYPFSVCGNAVDGGELSVSRWH